MNEIFKAFDRNNDGILSREELIQGYTQLFGCQEKATVEVEFILSKLDLNGSGVVDYSGKYLFDQRIQNFYWLQLIFKKCSTKKN